MPTATSFLSQSGTGQPGPCIGILADSDRLCNVISYVLAARYPLISQVVNGRADVFSPAEIGAMRLVILAAARPESEPLVLLGQAGLGCLLGIVPILLITDRQIFPAPDSRIFHLDYPFPPDALRQIVESLVG